MTRPEPTLAVRLLPTGGTPLALGAQYRSPVRIALPIALLRVAHQDPDAFDLARLPLPLRVDEAAIECAWAKAQLAADSTFLGLAVGLRVVLVPCAGRWHAEMRVVRTGGRLRADRSFRDPVTALDHVRRSLLASMGAPVVSDDGSTP